MKQLVFSKCIPSIGKLNKFCEANISDVHDSTNLVGTSVPCANRAVLINGDVH